MSENISVSNLPKTATFQMRINPEVKTKAEDIFARCGLSLTDAINVFLQQSINVEGLPLIVTQNSRDALREQAIAILMGELKRGSDSVETDKDWVSERDILSEFGIDI